MLPKGGEQSGPFDANMELDLKSVAASAKAYRLINFGHKSATDASKHAGIAGDYCTLVFTEIEGFRTVVPTLASVMTSGDGSVSSAGIFTDSEQLWIANGDGTASMLAGAGDAWHSSCIQRASKDAAIDEFAKRATGYNLNEKESKAICDNAPSYDPSEPAQVGLVVDDETEEIFFANGDGTRNLVVDPTGRLL